MLKKLVKSDIMLMMLYRLYNWNYTFVIIIASILIYLLLPKYYDFIPLYVGFLFIIFIRKDYGIIKHTWRGEKYGEYIKVNVFHTKSKIFYSLIFIFPYIIIINIIFFLYIGELLKLNMITEQAATSIIIPYIIFNLITPLIGHERNTKTF